MASTKWVRTDGGKTAAGIVDRNDCAVRAYSLFTGKPYAESHKMFSSMGRRIGKGTKNTTIMAALKEFPCTEARKQGKRVTLSQIANTIPVGKVYMLKRGHAFTMVNGVVHDSFQVGAKSIINMFWVDPKTVSNIELPPAKTPAVSTVSKPTIAKKELARAIFDRLMAYGTMSRYQVAKRMASEMDITVANAVYYCTRVFK